MWWNLYKFVFFAAMVVVFVCGMIFNALPQYQNILGTVAQVILMVVSVPLLIIVSILVFNWAHECLENFWDFLREYRITEVVGSILFVLGLFLTFCLGGAETESLYHNIVGGGIGLTMVYIGGKMTDAFD